MKKAVLTIAMLAVLTATPVFAGGKKQVVVNKTTVNNTHVQSDHNAFDYGAYLNLILAETPNTEWGLLGTWLNESNDTRVYLGGKVFLNRLTYQKK